MHVDEVGSTTISGSSSGAVNRVLVQDLGEAAVEGDEDVIKDVSDSNSKKVTFAESGKVHEQGSHQKKIKERRCV